MEEVPDGFYVNDSSAKTIDKCNYKCQKCSLNSNKNNFCISCNVSGGYYQKEDITKKYIEFVDCYDTFSDGYFLDYFDNIFKHCYKTCKKCEKKGNIYNHECTECYSNSTLNDTNCYQKCNYYYYFDSFHEYHCTEKEECPSGYKLISEKNKCIDKCNNDDEYKYEYKDKCYSSPVKPECTNDSLYINKLTNECLNECNGIDFFNNICGFRNNTDNNKDFMIEMIENEIESGLMNSLIVNILNDTKEDLLILEEDIAYQISTLKKQNNNINQNISSVSLGDCEDILKKVYNIDENQSLIIFKIDYYKNDSLIPIIGYEVFHPINNSKLDLKYCEEEGYLAINKYPVSTDEDSLFEYNPNSEYYLDECYPYTTKNGTDILLEDRQEEYNKNNKSICENNCAFKEYLTDDKKSICICGIKYKQIKISEINKNKNLFSNIFPNDNSSPSTFSTMRCYKTLFSLKGIYKNIAFYLILIIYIFTNISLIIFYKIGYNSLLKIIENIIIQKENKIRMEKENENIKEKVNKNNFNEKCSQNYIENLLKISTPKNRKLSRLTFKMIIPKEDISSINNYSTNQKSNSKIDLRYYNEIKYSKRKKINISNKNPQSNNSNYNDYNDFELNAFSYTKAIENDKRTFLKYYESLIKTKHPLLFSFYKNKEYNSIIVKIDIVLFSFCIYYFINGFFINKSIIHKLYIDGGYYDINYFMPKIIYSFLISHAITVLIKFFALSERNISIISKESNIKKAYEKMIEIKKLLIYKYIFFFSLVIFFVLFIGYNLSSFGAVYQNTQLVVIKNTLLSILISFIYPFVINLLPGMIRIYSLKDSGRKILFYSSKFLQLL